MYRSKDIYSCFKADKHLYSTYIDNLIKRYRACRVLGENDFKKICLFLLRGKMKGVCSNKTTTSNNFIPHSQHDLKGIDGEKERERAREREREH